MDEAAKGAAALASKDYAGAIQHYTAALSKNSQAVDYYIKRSTAYTRLSPANPLLALLDAETAVVLAHKRGKRELIGEGQLRRGIALFSSERWADAGQCFEWAGKMNSVDNSIKMWQAKASNKLSSLPGTDDNGEIRVKEMPDIDIDKVGLAAKKAAEAAKTEEKSKPAMITPTPQPGGVQTPASKIRHDWYQSADSVTVTLMAKGVPKDKATVDIQPGSLTVSFPLPTGSDFDFSLDPLFARIVVASSSFKIMSTKIEFILTKAVPGQKWHTLEGSTPIGETDTVPDESAAREGMKRAVLGSGPVNTAPVYPTSSKSGPKDWDKLAADLTKKPDKKDKAAKVDSATAEDEEPDMYIDEDEEDDGDPVNGFFKKLYKGADPDTRRAMMKSYQESNGTALSTNWAEVGKAPVETSPPDGMVAKQWGQ